MSAQTRTLAAFLKDIAVHRRRLLLLCAVAVLLVVLHFLLQKRLEVQAVSPQYQDIESTVSAAGVVVPVHDFQARANFSGMVDTIYVKLGQKVHAGQMLLRMKDQYAFSRIQSARAALQSAEVNYDNVRHNGSQEDRIGFAAEIVRAQAERDSADKALATLRQLEQKGSVSEAEVISGTRRLEIADAALHALNQRINNRYSSGDVASWQIRVAADKANVNAERTSYANANIASPLAGTVYSIPANLYDFVPMGADLLRVADIGQLQVRANFYEPDIGKLRFKEPVRITWDGAEGRTWRGQITAKPLAVNHSGGQGLGECIIALAETGGDLPVNSNVTVTATVDKHSHVLTIPRVALYNKGSSHFAYRVVHGRLAQTPVEVGLYDAFRVEIVKGLDAQDVVAVRTEDDEPLSNNRRVRTNE